MPFSHHSHSGQFCSHAADTLEEIVQEAIKRQRMTVFALTEHCPRGNDDLYPEEISKHDAESLINTFDAFIAEASRLRKHVQQTSAENNCEILIGFEAEWIRPVESAAVVNQLLKKHGHVVDYFIGSVHHVKTIPIDFDQVAYHKARQACGQTDVGLFSAYFDSQLEMLQVLRPKVVGHFDLIRLFSDSPDADLRLAAGGVLWPKVLRNLKAAKEINALLEINTSALRKGLQQPYPRLEICQAWMNMGGELVLSDDSHGVEQVGTNYLKVLQFLEQIGLPSLAYLSRASPNNNLHTKTIPMRDLRNHAFWQESKYHPKREARFC